MKFRYIIFILSLFNSLSAQQINNVDFISCKANLQIHPIQKKVVGNCSYTFRIIKKTDSIYIDAKNMNFSNVFLGKEKTNYKVKNNKLWFYGDFKKDKEYNLSLDYSVTPKKAMYFIDWEFDDVLNTNKQVWTQGQGKDNSNWIPCFDDVNEKLLFNLSISFDKNYKVISNGELLSVEKKDNFLNTWNYSMDKPMSSYLLAIVIGKYNSINKTSKNGTSLEMNYYPKDSIKIEPTYRYTKKIFDFLELEIGVNYPWKNYKQAPVKDFLYAGMENTTITTFSDTFVVDSIAFIDKNYINVNAHELAHQWFGNFVTSKSSKHHWLQEGFATYYALLAEKKIFGDDYFYYKLYNTSNQIFKAQVYDTIPLLNAKATSLTFYQKGAWVLYELEKLIGNKNFKNSIKLYLNKYQYASATTNDFFEIVEKVSGKDLKKFIDEWFIKSNFNKKYINEAKKLIDKKSVYYKIIEIEENIGLADRSLKNKAILERQKIIEKTKKIPFSLRLNYEQLLKDNSYKTIEISLLKLWTDFPNYRMEYLEKTKNIIGFNNKNIRVLWLALSLNTKGFSRDEYLGFYKELVTYTYSNYDADTRLNSFNYLNELGLINDEVIINLEDGAKHYKWRFKSFCKKLLLSL